MSDTRTWKQAADIPDGVWVKSTHWSSSPTYTRKNGLWNRALGFQDDYADQQLDMVWSPTGTGYEEAPDPGPVGYIGTSRDGTPVKSFADADDARMWVAEMKATGEFGWQVVAVPHQPRL